MKALMSYTSSVLEWLGRYVGLLVFGILFVTALLIRTTMMTGYFEWAEISSVPWYVYVSGGVILLLTLLWRKILKELTTKQIFIFFSVCFMIFGLLLICLTSCAGRAEAGTVFRGAVQFNAGNFSLIKPGAYFYRYPHQLGMLSFERLILYLIPLPVISVFYVLNLAMVIGMNYATWKITEVLFNRAHISRLAVIMSFGFLPLVFNIMFAYGLMYGLFFSSFAILFFLRYLRHGKARNAIVSVIMLTLAYWVRSNNIILILALSGILILLILREKRYTYLLLILAFFAFPMTMHKATTSYYEITTHQKISGTPQIAWLAMGLQDEPDSKRMPGWYTGYVRKIYTKKKGNIDKIEKSANHLFDKRVQYFLEHPDEASWFFSTKFISSWTEGSFQSIWNGPSKDKYQPLWNRFATSIYHDGTLHLFFVTYMQGYLLVLYLGGVFYYAFAYKRMGDGATLGLYAFLYLFGGILFHLISETKSQYTLPYIYLQLPMIAAGYSHMSQKLCRFLKAMKKSS